MEIEFLGTEVKLIYFLYVNKLITPVGSKKYSKYFFLNKCHLSLFLKKNIILKNIIKRLKIVGNVKFGLIATFFHTFE